MKVVDKVLSEGRLYLKFNDVFYKVKSLTIQGLSARFDCRSLENGEDYEINFKVDEKLLGDLIRFGLKDERNSIFIISEDMDRPVWFETSIAELIKEVEKKGLKNDLRRTLGMYPDMEV
ncbi:MAG: hypothetical protein QXJ75_04085 [Candidatus Bathyarchaeia archaeon]